MIPRVFWIALGGAAGVLAWRRAQQAAHAVTPAGIADRAGATADSLGERARGFWATTRAYAAEREAELRAALGLDVPDPDTLPAPGQRPGP